MNRSIGRPLSVAALILLIGVVARAEPNVLLIAIDDLRPNLGCFGDPIVRSPNIDALAASGRPFSRAYCQQAVCNPSRTSLMTGLRPDTIGVTGNHIHFRTNRPDVVTLSQHFMRHGYHAQSIGKIYHGFLPEGTSKTTWDTLGDPPSWSTPAIRFGPRYYYTESGIAQARQAYVTMYHPSDPGPDDWTEKLVFGPMTEAPDVTDETLHDGKVAAQAIETLHRLRDRRQPFFLAVGFIKPHTPFVAPKKYWDLYNPDQMTIAGETKLPAGAPHFAGHRSAEIRRYTDQPDHGEIPLSNQVRMKHGYYACISYVDAQIGKVLDALDATGLADNTIVALFGDHGYHLGEHGLWGKTTNFELDTHVPLIIRAPHMPQAGAPTRSLAELVDLYPTLADLAGLPLADDLEGTSLAPVVADPTASPDDDAISQYPRGKRMGYSLRTNRWRFTEWIETASGNRVATELYDHQRDNATETNNVADQHPNIISRLSSRLRTRVGIDPVTPVSNKSKTLDRGSIDTRPATTDRSVARIEQRKNRESVLMDGRLIVARSRQRVTEVSVDVVQVPILVGLDKNPILKIRIDTVGSLEPISVTSLGTSITGSAVDRDISNVQWLYADGGTNGIESANGFGKGQSGIGSHRFAGNAELEPGANHFWLSVTLRDDADIDHEIKVALDHIGFSNGTQMQPQHDDVTHRLGIALRQHRQAGVHTYRIPGLATTNQGTLISVYDLRYRSSSDLPGDIDVGMSRSTDGGRTWEPDRIIMDMGDDPQWRYDGIGDPAVLVDRGTGTIWVAATWSHGNRSWTGSGPGLQPEETGQLIVVRSDDDGKTWSKPINITPQVKHPEWCFLLAGPGKGITMRDGTIVFAAQYQDPESKERLPHSTIIYSPDHGQSWHVGTAAFDDTTEAQVIEVEPGVLMLNCRYNRKDARVVMTTRDLGKTWQKHASSEHALIEPTSCMASLIDSDQKAPKALGHWLLFSNPDSTESRSRIMIKASPDQGQSWPEQNRLLLDEGTGRGYSCLTMIDPQTIGILYESSQADMAFQRIPLRALTDHPDNLSALPSGQGKVDHEVPTSSPRSSKSATSPSDQTTNRDRRPNILLIVGEDHGCELSCYGDRVIDTPNMDRLAASGCLFENGYVTQSVCSPSRSTIFTGLYPHQNGQLGLATHGYRCFREFPTTYSMLKTAGYRTGLVGKTHINPESAVESFVDFRFQPKSNFAKKNVADYATKAGEFFRQDDRPFFLTVNYPDAHWPLQSEVDGLPTDRVAADKVQVMPYVGYENQRLRKVVQNYYDCMLRLDECVGQLIDQLERSGKADHTVVVFVGDHGAQMARGKVTVYEGGLHVPFIIRWPGTTTPPQRSKALVSTIDLLPTFADIAGAASPAGLPGQSLRPLLEKDVDDSGFRPYLVCERNCDAAMHTFPQRTIRDSRYKLIHSPIRDREDPAARYYRIHGATHWSGCPTDTELQMASESTKRGYARWLNPPDFQLYDLESDPHEWNDLSGNPQHASVKERLTAALRKWQQETSDPLADPTALRLLMKENDEVAKTNHRWPENGWMYLQYFRPPVETQRETQ